MSEEVSAPPTVASAGWSARWRRHVQRLGGMLVSPRATLRRLLAGEGRLDEVALWLIVLTAAVSPVRTGRAILVGRLGVLDGVLTFLAYLQTRLPVVLLALLIGAGLLMLVGGQRRLSFGRAVDVAGFLLVPVLLLTALGIVLRSAGVDLWFLPHRTLRGSFGTRALHVALSYGWSMVLLVVAMHEIRRPASATTDGSSDPSTSGLDVETNEAKGGQPRD